MPQRNRTMHNDALHAPLAIGGWGCLYSWSLAETKEELEQIDWPEENE